MNMLKLLHLFTIQYIRAFNLVEKYQPTYNPKGYWLFGKDSPKRKSEDRVKFIEESLNFRDIGSYLDIGSLFGYFVFRLATKHNLYAQGIDLSPIYVTYSQSIAELNDISNVSFTTMKLTASNVDKLPQYDLISFLNVFHHTVHFEGFNSANKIMRTLAKKCKYFVFETGIYTEKSQYWTKDLAFMGKDPEKWVTNYLTKIGFTIISVKNYPNHLNTVTRPVYICKAK